jgi:hypothetical protein
MGNESTTTIRRRRWNWKIMVVSFFFISFPRASSYWPTLKILWQPSSTSSFTVRRFPISLSFVFLSEPLSDIQRNALQKWLANFPRLGDRHLCSSLTPVYIYLHAPMTILLYCRCCYRTFLLCWYYRVSQNISSCLILSLEQLDHPRLIRSVWYGMEEVGAAYSSFILIWYHDFPDAPLSGIDISISMSLCCLVCGLTETANSHMSYTYCPLKLLELLPDS